MPSKHQRNQDLGGRSVHTRLGNPSRSNVGCKHESQSAGKPSTACAAIDEGGLPIFRRADAFRARTPERDRSTDLHRLDEIGEVVRRLTAAIADEAKGLRSRYEASQQSASMMLMQIEGSGSETQPNPQLETLDRALVYCETRRRELDRQRALLEQISALVEEEARARAGR